MSQLDLVRECPGLAVHEGFFRAFKVFTEELEIPDSTLVEVTLCSDARISEIHRDALGLDGPTDCIAFPLDFPELTSPPPFLGAFYMGVEEVRRNAQELGRDFSTEAAFVLAHGLLHLLGHEDSTEAEKKAMFARQEDLLRALSKRHTRWKPMFSLRRTKRSKGSPPRL